MRFTVFGAGGYIGSHLKLALELAGHEVFAPERGAELDPAPGGAELGHAIYAIGLTGDFRTRHFDTIEAHVALLSRILETARYSSFLYLSSTRSYQHGDPDRRQNEEDMLQVKPSADGIYDISKLLGESICLAQDNSAVRVARLSNVYSRDMAETSFLGQVLNALRMRGNCVISESPDSAKDYVHLDDVVGLLVRIAAAGSNRIYNVASGENTTHRDVAERLAQLTGADISFKTGAPTRRLPPIDVNRVASEFDFRPKHLLSELAGLI
ncbi:MAG: SDR family oxidoreductase [Hyphomicrobiaceae bacterium]|nr:SDR family oxidoreductase [Hyphomicrobiaceae bacterium]